MNRELMVKRLEIALNFIEDCLLTETQQPHIADDDQAFVHARLVEASNQLHIAQQQLEE